MAFPSPATKANCDSSTDDPKLALLVDLAGVIDKFNLLREKALEHVDLEDYGDVDTTGVTEATAIFNTAATACAAQGKALLLPAGTLLLDALALPTTLPGVVGRGKYATVLKFKRRVYTAGQILMNASGSTKLSLSDFGVDCQDACFDTAGTFAIVANNTTGNSVKRIRFIGASEAVIYAHDSTEFTATDNDVIGTTGGINVAISAGGVSYMADIQNNKISGTHTVGAVASGGYGHKILHNTSNGSTGPNFAFYLAATVGGLLNGNIVRNSQYEALHLRDTFRCVMQGNVLWWDVGYGVDMGISLGGDTSSGFNKVSDNIIVNAYAAGIGVGDNTTGNDIENNLIVDCAVRGTAGGGSGTWVAALATYTILPGSVCVNNKFSGNTIYNNGTAVTYAMADVNAGGSGATISGTRWLFNETFGAFTTPYNAATPSIISETVWRSFTPTISPAGGAITSYTVNSARHRRVGQSVEMTLDITITNAGTGTGALTILFGAGVPNAASSAGILSGKEAGITSKMAAGVCNAGGLVVLHADATTVISTGARVILSGTYRTI